jgi:hypothetical protein
MPFCPVCRIEFIEGTATCTDCGHELVGSLPPETAEKKKAAVYIDDVPAFLTSGSSGIECGLIEASLKTAGIPFLKKDRMIGGYMRVFMGYSMFGSDYHVPSKLLLKAQAALDATSIHGDWEDDAGPETQGEDTPDSEGFAEPEEFDDGEMLTDNIRARIIKWAVIIVILLILYFI